MNIGKRKTKRLDLLNRSKTQDRPLIPLLASFEEPLPGMQKIGDVARRVNLSVQTIRLYEAEGLLISFK
jgi:hypothetical protein